MATATKPSDVLSKAKPISEEKPDKAKVLIHGNSGTGKTFMASSIAEVGKTLYVDLPSEGGIHTIKGQPWADNIDLLRPEKVEEVADIFNMLWAGEHDYEAVVFESVSALARMAATRLLGYEENTLRSLRDIGNTLEIRQWGALKNLLENHSMLWYQLAEGRNSPKPIHVVMTSQSKLISPDEDDDLTDAKIDLDLSAGPRVGVRAKPDYVWYTFVEAVNEGPISPVSNSGETNIRHVMRVLPHPQIEAKSRVPAGVEVPAVVGRKGQVTMSKMLEVLKINE